MAFQTRLANPNVEYASSPAQMNNCSFHGGKNLMWSTCFQVAYCLLRSSVCQKLYGYKMSV